MTLNQPSILEFFGVKSQKELHEFIESNPSDEKVLELKSLFAELNVKIGDINE